MCEQLPTARQPSVERTYLQKNTLAQAIARVYRLYPDKESGLVVDYIGVFEDLQRALAFDTATRSERIGVAVGRVQVRAMRRKWASCSSRGTLTLSADLLRLSRDPVEYVVCHELIHLQVPAHGKGWQALMGAYLPDWRERERRLAGWMLQGTQRASS